MKNSLEKLIMFVSCNSKNTDTFKFIACKIYCRGTASSLEGVQYHYEGGAAIFGSLRSLKRRQLPLLLTDKVRIPVIGVAVTR
jgi:hypothetical protein